MQTDPSEAIKKITLGKRFKTVLFFTAICAIVYFTTVYWHTIYSTLRDEFLLIVLVATISALAQFNQSYIMFILLDKKVQLYSITRVWGLSGLLNYLGPLQTGTIVRMSHYKFSGVKWSTIVSANANSLIATLFICLCGLVIFLPLSSIETSVAIYLLTLLPVVLIASILLNEKLSTHLSGKIPNKKYSNLLLEIKPNQKILQLSLLYYLIFSAFYYLLYNGMGINISPADATILASIMMLSTLISITPNGLGVVELVNGVMAILLGANPEEVTSVVVVARVSHVLSCTITYCGASLIRRKTHTQ